MRPGGRTEGCCVPCCRVRVDRTACDCHLQWQRLCRCRRLLPMRLLWRRQPCRVLSCQQSRRHRIECVGGHSCCCGSSCVVAAVAVSARLQMPASGHRHCWVLGRTLNCLIGLVDLEVSGSILGADMPNLVRFPLGWGVSLGLLELARHVQVLPPQRRQRCPIPTDI